MKSKYKWLVIALSAVLIGVVIQLGNNVVSSQILPTLSNTILTQTALAEARAAGLQGQPLQTKSVRATQGQWMSATGQGQTQTGSERNLPVFLYEVRGQVQPTIGGFPDPTATYNRIIIVLSAKSGRLIGGGVYTTDARTPLDNGVLPRDAGGDPSLASTNPPLDLSPEE